MKNKYEIRGDVTAIYVNCKGKMLQTLVDTSDLNRLLSLKTTWYAKLATTLDTYYVECSLYNNRKRKTVKLHRYLTEAPKNKVVDHKNHNGLDNRRSDNLRVVSHAENIQNLKGARSDSSTGIPNVKWSKANKCWVAIIKSGGKALFQKQFYNIEEAKRAAEVARSTLFPFSSERQRIAPDETLITQAADAVYRNNKTGVRGVCWSKRDKLWIVQYYKNKKRIYRSSHKCFDDAIKVADDIREKIKNK